VRWRNEDKNVNTPVDYLIYAPLRTENMDNKLRFCSYGYAMHSGLVFLYLLIRSKDRCVVRLFSHDGEKFLSIQGLCTCLSLSTGERICLFIFISVR
jgi:hypothetical protein